MLALTLRSRHYLGVPSESTRSPALASGFDTALGIRVVHSGPDEVVLEYDIDDRHRQPYGIVHGGMHCAVVETACSIGAAMAAAARNQAVVGVENHTSFVHAVRTGRVTVTARPLTRGRRSQLWQADARTADGTLVASGRVRLLALDAGAPLAGKAVATKR
ncbi:MAG: PaaI family thioesterase [Deltaproteobacteria bacterium]|nr:PaaI family thioesterase [Deltaproteobacteria bacterium]